MNQQYKCKYDFDKYIQDNSNVDLRSMGSNYCTSCNGKTGFSRIRKGMVIIFDSVHINCPEYIHVCCPSHRGPILNVDYNEEALFFFSQNQIWIHWIISVICRFKLAHMKTTEFVGPGRCLIVLFFNTGTNRESVEKIPFLSTS